MNNNQIIANECIKAGLYTEEQIREMLEKEGSICVHTIKEWFDRGYKIRKGEHACITTRLWKMSSDKEKNESHFFLAKAFLFDKSQTERRERVHG